MDEIKNNVQMAINTLNTVEVRGRENMNHLLGSIMVLEQVVQQITAMKAPDVPEIAIAGEGDANGNPA